VAEKAMEISMPVSRRRILFAYGQDAEDITTQSGRPHSILAQLRARANVVNVSPLNQSAIRLLAPLELLFGAFGRVYHPDRDWLYLRQLARQVERTAAAQRCDVVFSPGSLAVSLLRSDAPIVFCADAPFGAMIDFYHYYSNVAPLYRKRGFQQEAEAHRRCAAAIYPSRWAADIAIKLHGAAPERTHVIPFGANVDAPPTEGIDRMLDARGSTPLRVLFIGRDFARKGGPLTVEACRLARKAGREVILHVVGVRAEVVPADPFIVTHGVLDMRQDAQRTTLQKLLSTCHVLFTPSRAEAYGLCFCEASAFAMPSLTTKVGGIPTIIEDGVTGWTLSLEADAAAFAEKLLEMSADPERYRAMAWRARRDYEARLNWTVFTDRLWRILEEVWA
jgi:glycosyltransferase involved in cell wall biosynthesis